MENNYDVVLEDIIYKITMAAAVANNFVSLPITIAVNGLVLTGELISVLEYFHYYAERNREVFSDADEEEPNAKLFREEKSFILKNLEEGEKIDFNFFHMKNVMMMSGGSCSDKGTIWRGKISDISAFSWNYFNPSKNTITIASR
jgi:hypothetical protein